MSAHCFAFCSCISTFFLFSLFLAFYLVSFAYTICHLTIERNVNTKFCLLWLPTNQFSLSLTVCALFWFLQYGSKKKIEYRSARRLFRLSCVPYWAQSYTCNMQYITRQWLNSNNSLFWAERSKKCRNFKHYQQMEKKVAFHTQCHHFGSRIGRLVFFFFANCRYIMVVAPLRTIQFVLYNDETSNNNTNFFYGTSKLNTQ